MDREMIAGWREAFNVAATEALPGGKSLSHLLSMTIDEVQELLICECIIKYGIETQPLRSGKEKGRGYRSVVGELFTKCTVTFPPFSSS